MFSTLIILCLSLPIFLSVEGADASSKVIKKTGKMGFQLLPYLVSNCNSETLLDTEVILYPDQEGFAFNVTLDREVNNQFFVVVKIDMFQNGQWMENYLNSKGSFCEITSKYSKGAWNKVVELSQPKIKNKCIIEPNRYVMPKTHFTSEDLEIPLIITGKFRVEVKLFTPENEELLCNIMEAEVK